MVDERCIIAFSAGINDNITIEFNQINVLLPYRLLVVQQTCLTLCIVNDFTYLLHHKFACLDHFCSLQRKTLSTNL
jgi:hypothetical protein